MSFLVWHIAHHPYPIAAALGFVASLLAAAPDFGEKGRWRKWRPIATAGLIALVGLAALVWHITDPDGQGDYSYGDPWRWTSPMHVRVSAGIAAGLAIPLARALFDLDSADIRVRSARTFAHWVLLPCAVISLLPIEMTINKADFLGVNAHATVCTLMLAICLVPWFAAHTRAARSHAVLACAVAVPLLALVAVPQFYVRPYPNWWFGTQEAYTAIATLATLLGVWTGGMVGDVLAMAPATLRGQRVFDGEQHARLSWTMRF